MGVEKTRQININLLRTSLSEVIKRLHFGRLKGVPSFSHQTKNFEYELPRICKFNSKFIPARPVLSKKQLF